VRLPFGFGPVLGGLFAGEAVVAESFRLPIYLAGGLALIASVWCLAVLRDAVPPKGKGAPLPAYSEAFRFVGGQPLLKRLFVISCCGIAMFASMEAIYGLWSNANFGFCSWTTAIPIGSSPGINSTGWAVRSRWSNAGARRSRPRLISVSI